MRILLDTQVFLLYIIGPDRLPRRYFDVISNPANDIFLSVVSNWEISVKYQIGKLVLPEPPQVLIPQQRELHAIASFPLDEASVGRLLELPNLHRDPFDRMLVCQALAHELIFATLDETLHAYPTQQL